MKQGQPNIEDLSFTGHTKNSKAIAEQVEKDKLERKDEFNRGRASAKELKKSAMIERDEKEYAAEHTESLKKVTRKRKPIVSNSIIEETKESILKSMDAQGPKEELHGKKIWEKELPKTIEKPERKQWWKRGWLRKLGLTSKVITAPTIAAATMAASHGEVKPLSDSTGTKINEIQTVKENPKKDSTERKWNIYTSSKTKEGGVTPTGLSNSFLENEYKITVADLDSIAQQYGFRNQNEGVFQEDMINYLTANHPEIIQKVIEKYGQTTKGRGINKNASLEEQVGGLKDNLLGRRDTFAAYLLKQIPPRTPESSSSKEEQEQPKGGYVINVRGDENDKEGVYYFFKDEKDFMEATDKIGHYSHRQVSGDGTGQATVDMPAKTFLKEYAKGKEYLLGQAWGLDNRTTNVERRLYKKIKTIASYEDGLVTK